MPLMFYIYLSYICLIVPVKQRRQSDGRPADDRKIRRAGRCADNRWHAVLDNRHN